MPKLLNCFGKQKGKDDERYLWDEMFRVIKEVRPRWIIGENVQNLTNISNGEILQGIYNDLESQGYEVQTFNISASSQGAWHKRSRIWIVALTPSASCYMDVVAPPQTVQKNSQGWSVTRVKSGVKYGAKLNDVMNKIGNKIGGKLNPNFLEFLMGYKQNHTLIEPTELKHLETQSYHKSLPKLDRQLSQQRRKMYRTPTAMDTGKDSFVYAAKILNGKVNRNSNSRVQITLSTDVAIKFLKENPHLIKEYDKPFKIRPNLPNKIDFINYLKSQTNIKQLTDQTNIKKTTIEHWFRKDNSFAYPTIENWNTIKKLFNQLKYDYEMTHEIEEDWKS